MKKYKGVRLEIFYVCHTKMAEMRWDLLMEFNKEIFFSTETDIWSLIFETDNWSWKKGYKEVGLEYMSMKTEITRLKHDEDLNRNSDSEDL